MKVIKAAAKASKGIKGGPPPKDATKVSSVKQSPKTKGKAKVGNSPAAQKEVASRNQKSDPESALHLVEAALVYGYGVPSNRILEKMCRPCLETTLGDRQPLQHRGVELLATQMGRIQAHLGQELQSKVSFLQGAPQLLRDNTQAHEGLLAMGLQLSEQKRGLLAKLEEERQAASSSTLILQEAMHFRDEVFNSAGKLSGDLDTVKSIQTGQLKSLKEGSADHPNKLIKVVSQMCQSILRIEEGVYFALPSALRKAPADRGPFDLVTLSELDKQLRNWIMDTEFKINNQSSREADSEQKVSQCQLELGRIDREMEAVNELFSVLNEKIESTKAEARATEKTLKAHPKEVVAAEEARETLQSDVNRFAEVMHKFRWLQNRSPDDSSFTSQALVAVESSFTSQALVPAESFIAGQKMIEY